MDMNIPMVMVTDMDMAMDITKKIIKKAVSRRLSNPSSVKKEKRALALKRQRR